MAQTHAGQRTAGHSLGRPQLGHPHRPSRLVLVRTRVLGSLMPHAIVLQLRHAQKLTIRTARPHRAVLILAAHRRLNAKAVADVQMLLLPRMAVQRSRRQSHIQFDVAVDEDAPGVQLFAVLQHHSAGVGHVRVPHHGAHGTTQRLRLIGEGSQMLGEVEQSVDVGGCSLGGRLVEAVANGVADGEALRGGREKGLEIV